MKQINLKSNNQVEISRHGNAGLSLVLSTVFLLISGSIYGVVFFQGNKLESEIEAVESSIKSAKEGMDAEGFLQLYDFQDRLLEIGKIVDAKEIIGNRLSLISSKTLPEVQFSSYDQKIGEDGEVEIVIEMKAKDYELVSRQLEAYTQLDGVSRVNLTSSRLGEGTGLIVSIELLFVPEIIPGELEEEIS